MTEQEKQDAPGAQVPEALIEEHRGFSIVWLIPLVAALVGGWLAYKAVSERGPTVTIIFKSAAGMEAGKTKVKYKDVDVGQVVDITIGKDLSHVVITAELDKGTEPFLTDKTLFWVVRARVSAGQVTGLGTLFSGAYIGVAPATEGKKSRSFTGLERPPVVTADEPGRHFTLRAKRLSSLEIGTPIYFRQIKAGEVVDYGLDEDGKAISIRIFLRNPFDQLVSENTRFWDAGGIDISLSAEGLKVETESFVSLMVGGVEFDVPPDVDPGQIAQEDRVFELFANRATAFSKTYSEREFYVAYFKDAARGLTAGAPVELAGIKIGEVADVALEVDVEELEFRVRALMVIEPGRAVAIGHTRPPDAAQRFTRLVEKGLRAQLDVGNLLTGQLLVKLDIHPDSPRAPVMREGDYLVVPTIPTTLQQITTSLTQVLQKLEQMPIEEIAIDLRDTVRGAKALVTSSEFRGALKSLNGTLEQMEILTSNLNAQVSPELNQVLVEANRTLTAAHNLLREGSVARRELERTLGELSNAARSIRVMTDYLERHPEALIQGKGGTR
ncbi:MAG: MlaD family protein [Gammaproteobacteria bacterium]|nr:MlaD family protein [Gammaproteobacteria bacterium]